MRYYNALGYVPYNVGINENVARTLEYAYDDFSIFKMAQKLGRPAKEIEMYAQRSLNYRNVFDKERNLMRGKNKDGKFQIPFNPLKWGDAFTEGNSWHYTWSVFHDIDNLANLMGGKKKFANMLDSVFILPPTFDDSYYGGTIHEIREMQIANMGQYAHGNQPIQHMIYLYNYAGQSYKTQYWVRETMNRMYKPTPDGYCGDEDNGQTSAWYVFSALGFYPVTPGVNQYVLGAPLFKKVTLNLENGKKFIISAVNNSEQNKYVTSQKLNNNNHTKTWLAHSDILSGGTFDIGMNAKPNKTRITATADLPYSFSRDDKAIYLKVKDMMPMSSEAFLKNESKPDTITKNGLTLYLLDEDNSFTDEYKKRFINAYFEQYPKLIKKYNTNSPTAVTFIIDKKYDGVAATSNGIITYNPAWFEKKPEDVDVITHELMHIVQDYGQNTVPGWITEGIADYVRSTEGINNEKAKWSLPDVKPEHNYNNSYRITARFFIWITERYKPNFVQMLDDAARKNKYSEATFKNITGKNIEELWKEYVADSSIKKINRN